MNITLLAPVEEVIEIYYEGLPQNMDAMLLRSPENDEAVCIQYDSSLKDYPYTRAVLKAALLEQLHAVVLGNEWATLGEILIWLCCEDLGLKFPSGVGSEVAA